ncbi:MAG: hypothetical protein RBU37_15720 [Myxococcota bacterium]|jgi:hypothetical protein|nr:hypothetical protein [Myxococcota bacterium]
MSEKEIRERLAQFVKDVDQGKKRTRLHRYGLQRWLMPPLLGASLALAPMACDSDEEDPDTDTDFSIQDYVAPWDYDQDEIDYSVQDYVAPWDDDQEQEEEFSVQDYVAPWDLDQEDSDLIDPDQETSEDVEPEDVEPEDVEPEDVEPMPDVTFDTIEIGP